MNNFVKKGDTISFTAGASYDAGDIIELTDRAVVACHDVASGDALEALCEGVVELPKADVAMTKGQKLYGDETGNSVSTSSSGAKAIGWAWEDSATGLSTVQVKLGAF